MSKNYVCDDVVTFYPHGRTWNVHKPWHSIDESKNFDISIYRWIDRSIERSDLFLLFGRFVKETYENRVNSIQHVKSVWRHWLQLPRGPTPWSSLTLTNRYQSTPDPITESISAGTLFPILILKRHNFYPFQPFIYFYFFLFPRFHTFHYYYYYFYTFAHERR